MKKAQKKAADGAEKAEEAYEDLLKDPTIQELSSQFGDYSPNELVNFLSTRAKDLGEKLDEIDDDLMGGGGEGIGDMVSNLQDVDASDMANFAQKFLRALIPSAKTMGDILTPSNPNRESKLDVRESAMGTLSSDRVSRGKIASKRASITARKCSQSGCNELHFGISEFCPKHDKTIETSTESVMQFANNNLQGDEKEQYTKLMSLRREMQTAAETFSLTNEFKSLDIEARRMLRNASDLNMKLDDGEIGQMLYQFRRLDVDGNGVITVDDLHHWVQTIDSDWIVFEPNATNKIREWFMNSTPSKKEEWDFETYVRALLFIRSIEATKKINPELLRTGFWDLRLAVLQVPTEPLEGFVLKRGHVLPMETLNSWYQRYFRIHGTHLEYYNKDPKEADAEKKGVVDLQDIAVVDFSAKTTVSSPKNIDPPLDVTDYVVFKVTMFSGRRFTLAAPHETAVRWAALLSWYAESSRQVFDWKENWGTRRKFNVTLRDYVNAGAVLAKLAEAKKNQKKITLTARDRYHLSVVGVEEDNMELGTQLVIQGIELWHHSKKYLEQADKAYLQGMGGYTVTGINTAISVYKYATKVKNRMNENKYGVKWVPKLDARECAICHYVFKSFTLRKTLSKHHCRACGRVVCHNCSPRKVFLDISGQFERVCNECIEQDAPSKSKAKGAQSLTGRNLLFSSVWNAAKSEVEDEVNDAVSGMVEEELDDDSDDNDQD